MQRSITLDRSGPETTSLDPAWSAKPSRGSSNSGSKNTIRTVIADDHTIVRAGIRLLLESMEDVEVVAEAANGIEAMDLVRVHRPEVLLADIAMPYRTGLELVQLMTEESLPTRVVILSMHGDHEYVRRAIKAGARGYLLKGSGLEELSLAIHAVARGDVFLSPSVTQPFLNSHDKKPKPSGSQPRILTPRQLQVLRLIAQGETTKSSAHRLGISVKTVETHRSQLMDRLQIHDVAGLVKYAIRSRLIDSDP